MHPGLSNGPIYLDYNATTPIDPRVVEAMQPYFIEGFGNPSSTHWYGQAAHQGVDLASRQVADLLGCQPEEIIFTGGGSEGDNLAIRGAALANQERGKRIITQVTEHPAVLNTCRALEQLYGFEIVVLPVDRKGQVRLEDLQQALQKPTVLVSIMHANNETGTLQPVLEITEMVHQYGALMHSDAAQSVGKLSVRVEELGVDFLSFAGHKLYAPKGIGALYTRAGLKLEPLIYGGGQGRGLRAGTENVPYIIGLGVACTLAAQELPEISERMQQLRNLLHRFLLERAGISRVHLHGHVSERLPNTLNVGIDRLIGEKILAATPGIASSTGSACHEGGLEPSEVLLAMGFEREEAFSSLRLTLGRWSNEEQIQRAADLLAETIATFT